MSNAGSPLILPDDWRGQKAEPAKPAPAPAAGPASGPGSAKTPAGLEVDSDWKNQAQAERERLAAEEAQRKAKAPAGPGGKGGQRGLPAADFQALVSTLITQALMYMGAFPDPETGRAVVSPEYAAFHIDLLAVLQQKTAGNLTADEAADLDKALHELRANFVELIRAIDEMGKAGKLRPASNASGPSAAGLSGLAGLGGTPPIR